MKLINYLFIAVLVAAAPFFFWGGPSYYTIRSLKNGWDLGHVLFFSILTVLLFQCIQARRHQFSSRNLFIVLFALVLLAGITVELLQMYSNGRLPDIFDLMRNQVGCLVGFLFIYRRGRPGIHSRYFQVFQITAVVLLLLVLWPFARSVSDELVAEKQFPLLSDFETPFETSRWKNPQQIKVQDLIVRHGRKSAKVFLSTARYSGVSLFYFPGNWESYRWLRFSVYNPDQDQLILHCRIHDVDHKKNDMDYKDRYGRKFRLTAGWNDLSVDLKEVAQSPATRSMDMRNIENLGLFVVQQQKPRILYIDHFYLEK